MPKEYYWAQQIIARTPADSPVHQEALVVLAQIAREQHQDALSGMNGATRPEPEATEADNVTATTQVGPLD